MESGKMRLRPNEWMISEQFLSIIDYHNVYYIEALGKVLYAYLETVPIPVITTWDPVHKRIYFLVGEDKRFFEVDENVSYFDFTYMVEKWLSRYFPKFCVEEEKDVFLDEEEVLKKVKEGTDLDEALKLKSKKKVKDIGIIKKIQIDNDEFYFDRNGEEYIRITGSLEELLPLSKFLRELRKINSDIDKRSYILSNSRELKKSSESDNKNQQFKILVDHEGTMMMNFFIIRYDELKNKELSKITDHIYEWDKFEICFQSKDVEKDCLHYLKQKRMDEGIE